MGVVKQINIKSRTYYFYNDITNLKHFESKLLKIDKKSHKNIGIYNIGYITIKKMMINGEDKKLSQVPPLIIKIPTCD